MKKIDCLGEICPIPILALQKEMQKIKEGETVMLVTDHSCSCRAVEEFCGQFGLACSQDEVMNGVWEITIERKS